MRLAFTSFAVFLALASCEPSAPSPERVEAAKERIFGGIPDTWRAYVVGVGDQNGPFCTGTVIGKRTVLTAGHCFPGIKRVFFGNDLNTSPTIVIVKKEVRHPLWDGNTLAHDITMVQLAADAPVQPAPLLYETMNSSPAWVGTKANDSSGLWLGPNFTFVGYGLDEQMNFGLRRVAAFPILHVGAGNVGGTPGMIDDTQYYYAYPKKNTCNGDSGGPAFAVRAGGVEHITGTTSFGDGPCVLDGVNARVDMPEITGWIQSQIDAFEGAGNACRANGVCDETCNTGPNLVDPDCAKNHCGQDGICALSCVAPFDPDCVGASRCGFDGACDPTCMPMDPDCAIFCGPDSVCMQGCPTPDPDCVCATAMDGTPCFQGPDACLTYACTGGVCAAAQKTCPAGECLKGVCDVNDGCSNNVVPNGTPCSTGVCMAGACTPVMTTSASSTGSSSSAASSASSSASGSASSSASSAASSSGATSTSATSSSGTGGAPSTSSSGGAPSTSSAGGAPSERNLALLYGRGCSCTVPGTTGSTPASLFLLGVGLAATGVRRRRIGSRR